MSVHDELETILEAGRWRDLTPYLVVDGGPGKEVMAWYRSRHRHWLEHYRWGVRAEDPEIDGQGALRGLVLACATPAQAAKEFARLTFGWTRNASDQLVVAAAAARGHDFCQAFLATASRQTYGQEEEWTLGWLARFALPLVAAGVAELPDGPAFGRGWAHEFASGAPDEPLVDRLRTSPAVAEGLSLAIASPRAMAAFEAWHGSGPQLEDAVARLVEEGVLERERVLRDILGALTRQDTAHSQRTLARLLAGLGFSGADAAPRVPTLLQLLATVRGPVTAALLPALLDAAGDEDVVAVAETVFARPEKAQRQLLLRRLVAGADRWSRDAQVRALTVAAQLPDEAMAGRATKALTTLGAEAPAEAALPLDGLWAEPPPSGDARPAVPVAPDEAPMTAALSRMTVSMDASDGAMLWDAVVRWTWSDPDAVRAWARGLRDPSGEGTEPTALLAVRPRPWDTVVSPAGHRSLCETVARVHTGLPRRPGGDMSDWNVISRTTTQALHDVFVSETRLRLGTVPHLLSTPTRTDGSLDLNTLVERLRAYGEHLVGPADLFVALTRLRPVDPGRAAELDGLKVGLWSAEEPEAGRLFRRGTSSDGRSSGAAAQVVREWVAGGGLPALVVHHDAGTVTVAPAGLPVPAATFDGIPPSLLAGHEDGVHAPYSDWALTTETDLGMVPGWADLLAARTQRAFDQKGRLAPRLLPGMAASPGAGRAVLHAVAATLSHADEDHRLLAVESALVLMGRGRWDPADYTACCEHLLAGGELRLARLTHSWEQLILAGALKPLWPTAVTVLDRACALERKPPGLAALLGMLRRYLPAVPEVVVPDPVVALASSRGSSKARAEAAAFVKAAS